MREIRGTGIVTALMAKPVVAGAIPKDGVISVLQEIETRRTSGFLRFDSELIKGEVVLVAGQVALDQADLPDGRDPVETFLALRSGRYEVHQKLPPLSGTTNDGTIVRGSIEQHAAADLLKYCDRIGLTGLLTLRKSDRLATAAYDRGELIAIRVDGENDADLHDVFAWEAGNFHIVAHSERPVVDDTVDLDSTAAPVESAAKRQGSDTGRQRLLKVVEVALTSVLEQAEKRRPSRTAPERPPDLPPRRPSSRPPPSMPSPPRPDSTVRIVYLEPRAAFVPEGIRHVQTDLTAEQFLPDAKPHRRPIEQQAREESAAVSEVNALTASGDACPRHIKMGGFKFWAAIAIVMSLVVFVLLLVVSDY